MQSNFTLKRLLARPTYIFSISSLLQIDMQFPKHQLSVPSMCRVKAGFSLCLASPGVQILQLLLK